MTAVLPHPVLDDATRRQFLALLGTGSLLTACGSGAEEHAPAGPPRRTADTPRGPVTIPADPQRVLAVYTHDLANALVLGLPVIAGPGENGQPGAPFPAYLTDAFPERTATLTSVAHRPQPNIEEIAALRPDCILAGMFGTSDDGLYDRLGAVAPTVTYRYSEGEAFTIVPWRTVLRENGVQFGREAAAQSWIGRFEQRVAQLRERLAARWAGATRAIIEPYGQELYVYGPAAGHMPATLTNELGLAPAAFIDTVLGGAPEAQGGSPVSPERVGELDADVVFLLVSAGANGLPDRSGAEALVSRPLWSSVPAVAAGQVHEVSGDVFYESGPMATAFLDVVERTLLA